MTRRRQQDLIIIAGVLIALLVAAVEIGAEVRANRPAKLHGDTRVFTIEEVDDVTPPTTQQLGAVQAGLSAIQVWLGAHAGAVVTQQADVLLTAHGHCQGAKLHPEAAGLTSPDGRRICLFTADTEELRTPKYLQQATAHEAVHVLQHQLGCQAAPSWVIEGMAEDLSWRATMAPRPTEAALASWAETEERLGQYDHLNYGTAMRAALELEGGHPDRLVTFCRAVGRGAPWALAFSQAFDASPGRYAARF